MNSLPWRWCRSDCDHWWVPRTWQLPLPPSWTRGIECCLTKILENNSNQSKWSNSCSSGFSVPNLFLLGDLVLELLKCPNSWRMSSIKSNHTKVLGKTRQSELPDYAPQKWSKDVLQTNKNYDWNGSPSENLTSHSFQSGHLKPHPWWYSTTNKKEPKVNWWLGIQAHTIPVIICKHLFLLVE